MIGHELGLRLFLEGVETPVIGASIQVAPDTPTAASIQVVATDKILDLLPRTLVHLFFYDFVNASTLGSPMDETIDEQNARYKLMFVGEVQGISFMKDAGQRAATLQCVDLSNYWDTTYQYNFGGSLFSGQRQAAFIGAGTNLLGGPLGHGVGKFAGLLSARSVNFPELKGLLAGIVRILEAIGGSYYGETTFKGANDFTSIAELRLKILQQITAAEKDDSSAKLFARKAFNMWMNRQMGSLGKLVTFRGVVQILQQFIFHGIYPCPAPMYQGAEKGLKKTKISALDIQKDPRARGFIQQITKLRKVLMASKNGVSLYPTAIQVGAVTYKQTTAEKISGSQVYINLRNSLIQVQTVHSAITTAGVPKIPGLEAEVGAITKSLTIVAQHIGGLDSPLSTEMLGSTAHRDAAGNALDRAVAACDIILGLRTKTKRQVTYDKLDRLNNQILRPDVWFVSPPRCNVLFPEMYQSFQWSRNFMREVSRMELQTTNEVLGDSQLFNGKYYAPNVESMRNGLRLSSRQFGGLILDHELLTGIIPMYEKMAEANLYAMKSRQVTAKGAKVDYAQRAVNHQYFKHRFASRQMSAEGRFNPWFVPGFPSVLIDQPMKTDKLAISGLPVAEQLKALGITPKSGVEVTRAMMLQELVPTQFFGCCVQIQHALNQEGGSTSYAFQQARIHREDTEFLGIDKVTINKKIGTSKRSSVVAAQEAHIPKVKGKGPNGGLITSVVDVTKQHKDRFVSWAPAHGTGRVWVYYPPSKTNPIKAYKVTETFTRRAKVNVDFPIEEAVRPPWIWDGYNNLKIGETYMQFFGTNAITDIDGFSGKDVALMYEGADTLEASDEVQAGYASGDKKEHSGKKGFAQRKKTTPPVTGEPLDNKPDPPGTFQAELGKKVMASAILTIEKERTIENSVDYLVRLYSFIKQQGMDVGEFIRNYTWRPVASMPEIMGSEDFTIIEDPPNSGTFKATGTEGFHSRAFGDVANLFGLVNPSVKKVMGLSKSKTPAAAEKLDVRARRRQAVWAYVHEITSSRGLLG